MAFYHLPFGHAEWHVDRRDPHPARIAVEERRRQRRRWRRAR